MNDPRADMRYGDYLALDAILGAQHARSSDPNGLLFFSSTRRASCGHVTTVERIIGNKTGTGGTSGVEYMRKNSGRSGPTSGVACAGAPRRLEFPSLERNRR